MEDPFVQSLVEQVLSALDSGQRDFAVLGVTEAALRLLAEIEVLGLDRIGQWTLLDLDDTRSLPDVKGHWKCVHLHKIGEVPIDVLVIPVNERKEATLRKFAEVDDRLPKVILAGSEHFKPKDPVFDELQQNTLVKSYATGYDLSLLHLYQAIKYLCRLEAKGSVVEFGMFRGGTTTFMARAFEHFGRADVPIIGFDAFAGFPDRRSLFDLYTNPDCEFKNKDAVTEHALGYNITVVEGDICQTYKVLEGKPLLLTFFDTDNYSPVAAALPLCYEQTVPGGVIAFDHYHSIERFVYTIGERMAAREFFETRAAFHLHGTGIFIKA